MKKTNKILISCFVVLILVGVFYFGYLTLHFKMYDDYKDSFKEYEYKVGNEYQPISTSHPNVEGMDLIAENEKLELYANIKTAEIAVYDKRNKITTYSNPLDVDSDAIANNINKSNMKSQLSISYYTAARLEATMNSYDSCTKNNQFKVEGIKDGVRFIYTIGDLSIKTGIVPLKLQEERMLELTGMMEKKDARFFKGKYKKNDDGIYELLEVLLNTDTIVNKMIKCLEKIEYTMDDCKADSEAAGAEYKTPISFTIPIEYTLGDDYVEVNIPTDHITESGGGSLYEISVLEFFSAASDKESGYFLIPNGSGSIINYNNKNVGADYKQPVYGMDPLSTNYNQIQTMESIRLPLWGYQHEDSTILASIEGGASLASINAIVSGKLTSYNNAFASFTIRGSETLSMSGMTGNEGELPVVEKDFNKVDLTIRYSFLPDEYDGYSGMASYYRERLLREGSLVKQEEITDLPLYLNILGGVRLDKYLLGVKYKSTYAMTTFEEAKKISTFFIDQGITPIVNYQGWFNKGYYHDVASNIDLTNALGKKKEFEGLSKYLEDHGGKLFADVAFQRVTYGSRRYSMSEESSRFYASGYPAVYGVVNPKTLTNDYALGYKERIYSQLSPKFLPRYVEEFSDEFNDYQVTGVSLRDLGSELNSDKKRNNVINREQALCIVQDSLKQLDESEKELMISDSNSYALKYADELVDVPLSDSDFLIVDYDVPFYEMVIHGIKKYCGPSLNLSENYDYQSVLLNLIEYGAAPHFTFTWENTTKLKYTSLNNWYNTSFNEVEEQKDTEITTYREDAVLLSQQVKEALSPVLNSTIAQHEVLDSGIRRITYENGTVIYVNRTNHDISIDGINVHAEDYFVKEGR